MTHQHMAKTQQSREPAATLEHQGAGQDRIERAKRHLKTCMERDDWPSHDCACNCGDVSELLAELDRLAYIAQAVRAFYRFPSDINKHVLFARLAEADDPHV